ncbi:MAG: GntR family transcriptional regulator [Oscillospiraceae bacterium]|nr:GntR family transcriptional regulator [Oscillospiraceae bacterium]
MNLSFDLGNLPSLKQLVYDHLLQMIIHGDLMPGERLAEDALSQSMNISRAPIREALNMLERDGFASIIPRKGAVVSSITNKDIRDIWTCRLALEPFAAKLSIHLIPEKAASDLLQELVSLAAAPYDLDRYIRSDIEVHELLYKYLDNAYLKSILENLKAHSIRMRWLNEKLNSDPTYYLLPTKEHQHILECILKRDEDALFHAVQQHLIDSSVRTQNPSWEDPA